MAEVPAGRVGDHDEDDQPVVVGGSAPTVRARTGGRNGGRRNLGGPAATSSAGRRCLCRADDDGGGDRCRPSCSSRRGPVTGTRSRRWSSRTAASCSCTATACSGSAQDAEDALQVSKVRVGDRVLARDPRTGERAAKKVTRVWVHPDTVVGLAVAGTLVTTTADHPFWNATDRAWQRADQLDTGDRLLTPDGRTVRVAGLRTSTTRPATAYNLTVADIHTYFVAAGTDPVLVHNTCDVRGLWKITKEGTERTVVHGRFGTFSKSKSDGLWWSRDTAGHGKSTWKVYSESAEGLEWMADANEYGDFISGKHKSPVGVSISWKELRGGR